MRYQLLIYTNEKEYMAIPKEEQEKITAEYMVYTENLKKSGALLAGDRLFPTSSAATVKVQDGKNVTTHGPFAETKEQLGGYYIVECKNLDEAIDWAAKCPAAKRGSMEVRPIMEMR